MNKFCLLLCCCFVSLSLRAEKFSFDSRDYKVFSELDFTWYFFDIYHVKVWTLDNELPDTKKPFIMTYDYRRDIKAKDLIKTSQEEWKDLELCNAKQSQLWSNELTKIWPDIKSGDQLTAWFNGSDTQFYQKKKFLGKISGKDFSEAFFQIWLHPKSQTASLRKRTK
jgi:hypothetical protein